MSECLKCNKRLSRDEIGLHKKLVNRAADEFMCIQCLAEYFEVDTRSLEEKINQYKELGCTLFSN